MKKYLRNGLTALICAAMCLVVLAEDSTDDATATEVTESAVTTDDVAVYQSADYRIAVQAQGIAQ